ncbi:MAG: M56 family metallopeptidase [Planctomycetia bacterium]|nr:M56 family metallopeptidase [Planctomycetia bacterium]
MMHSLLEWMSPVRQSALELIAQVTLWATAGLLVYLACKRMVASCRYLLLCFCLGILALSVLILFPLQLWNLPASWRTATSTVTGNWTVTTESETTLEPSTSLSPVSAEPVSIPTGLSFGDVTSVVIALLALLVTASLLRWLLGIIALEHWRRSSVTIDDALLLQQASQLCEHMGIRQSVALRVSPFLGSPATIGWWRPTILLPATWTEWQKDECKAVLAHELAHVRNRDFPLWLAVQFAAALHTYHPLVRYLVRQLLGELELAADRLAAPFAGGTTHYMRTLCQLALRHGRRRAGTLTLALFPVQIPLSWRMMMLRSPKTFRLTHGIWSRLCLAGLLATLAVAISGFRTGTVADEKETDSIVYFRPQPHPNSRVVNMKVMIVEMKEADLHKLAFHQQKNLPATIFISKSMEEIKKQLAGISFKETVPSCTRSAWSEVPTGICLSRKETEDKVFLVTPCVTDEGQSIELKSSFATVKKNPHPEMPVVDLEISSRMQIGQCACFVTSCDDADKKDLVRVTFVSVPSVHPVTKDTVKAENKQNYEINVWIAEVKQDQFQKHLKERAGSQSDKLSEQDRKLVLTGDDFEQFMTLVMSDVRNCVLATPKLVTIAGRPARIEIGQKPGKCFSIGCLLKQFTKDQIELTLSQEITVPGKNTDRELLISQGFTVALAEDKYFCFSNDATATTRLKEGMTMVTMVKVRKASPSPADK